MKNSNNSNEVQTIKYINESQFSPTFKKIFNKYSRNTHLSKMNQIISQAKQKHHYFGTIKLSNKSTIHENISNFFGKRNLKLFHLYGDEKDNYDDILDLNVNSNQHDKALKNINMLIKKYNFIEEKPKIDFVSIHKQKRNKMLQKQHSNSCSAIYQDNSKFINKNNSHLIKEEELLPIILNKPGRKYNKFKIDKIKNKTYNKIQDIIEISPSNTLDEEAGKRVKKLFEKKEMKEAMEYISMKYPLKSLNQKLYSIENKSVLIKKKKRFLEIDRRNEKKILENRFSFLTKPKSISPE